MRTFVFKRRSLLDRLHLQAPLWGGAIVSLFHALGGVVFLLPVIIKFMTHTQRSFRKTKDIVYSDKNLYQFRFRTELIKIFIRICNILRNVRKHNYSGSCRKLDYGPRDPAPCWFTLRREDGRFTGHEARRLQDVDVLKMIVDHELNMIVHATFTILR